jgi:hypothetical protein
LLLDAVPPVPVFQATTSYGTNGYELPAEPTSFTTAGTPQAIDAALANDEVDEGFLLSGFLDFVDPEMLVVDLGDEPPAQVAGDKAKMSPAIELPSVERDAARDNQLAAAAAAEQPAPADEIAAPSLDDSAALSAFDRMGAQFQSVAMNHWRKFASTAAVLLIAGAAWKGRNAWMQAARKMWSR